MGNRAFRNRGADLRRGGRVVAVDDVKPVPIARLRCFATGQNRELDTSRDPFGMLPTGEGIPLVAAHDPEQAGIGKSRGHGDGGLIGIGRPGLLELEIIDHRPGNAAGGEAEHLATVLSAGERGAVFVRGNLAGEKTDFIELQRVPRHGRQMEMTEVDGIEGSAEESDLAGGWHGRGLGMLVHGDLQPDEFAGGEIGGGIDPDGVKFGDAVASGQG